MTSPDTHVTIDPDDSGAGRRVPIDEVKRRIEALTDAGKLMLAASLATQLAEQRPGDVWPQWRAAQALHLHEEPSRAFEYIERALEIDARNIACLVLKARLLLFTGEHARSIETIDAALRLEPHDSKLHGIKAELLMDSGDTLMAGECFRHAIRLDPHNTSALLGLSRLPGRPFDRTLVGRVEDAIRSGSLQGEDLIRAHFALALALDDLDDRQGHIRHLAEGNALKDRTLGYDPRVSTREAAALVDFFTPDFFARQAGMPDDGNRPIFIVGFPRCGSTLVEQILSSHPDVTGAGETNALRHALRDFERSIEPERGYPYWLDDISDDSLAAIASGYRKNLRIPVESGIVTDKLLDNYKFIGVIELVFPQATIIDVQRDPVDTCYSCYKRLFNLGTLPFAYSLANLASRYRDYRRLMRHWDRVLPGRVRTIEYEQLVRDQAGQTSNLLDACGLAWDDACLAFHETRRTVSTSSNVQVRRPIYEDAVGRWRRYADALAPLLDLRDD